MTKVHDEVVEHDGGWAYRVDGVFSETFASHDLARAAADGAPRQQGLGGEDDAISYEDAKGCWHDKVARGDDRPETEVEG